MIAGGKRGLRGRALLLTGGRIAGAGVGLGAQILLARFMGPAELGLYYIVTSALLIMATIVSLAYGGVANRLVVRYQARNDDDGLNAFLGAAIRDVALACLAGGSIFGFIFAAVGPSDLTSIAYAVLLVSLPALALMRVAGGIANALGHGALAFLPDTTLRPAFLALGVALWVMSGVALDLSVALTLFGGVAIALAAGQSLILWRLLGRTAAVRSLVHTLRSQTHIRRREAWRASALRLLPPLLLGNLFGDIIILIAGWGLVGAQIGVFGAAVKIAFLLGFLTHVTHQLLTPRLAVLLGRGDREGAAALIKAANLGINLFMIVATIMTLFFGSLVMSFFGEDFRAGAGVLMILAVAQLIRAVFGPGMSLLVATGRQASALRPQLFGLGVLLILGAVLSPIFGSSGMAFAVLAATTATSGLLAKSAWHKTGQRADIFAGLIPWGQPQQPRRVA